MKKYIYILICLLIVSVFFIRDDIKVGDYTITSVVNTPSNQIANLIRANHWPLLQTFNGGVSATYVNATSTTATSTFDGGLKAGGASGLIVTSTGMVGIATTTPYAPLSVNGKIAATVLSVDGTVLSSYFAKGIGIGTSSPNGSLHISNGASATTTITIGELGLTSSKSCINMNQVDGASGSIYIAGGVLIVENNYCK